MPERYNLEEFRIARNVIVEVIVDALDVNATNAFELHTFGTSTDPRLQGHDWEKVFDLFANCIGGCPPIEAPPRFCLSHLIRRRISKFDV